MEGYIGQIMLFAGTFAPRNWQYCYGQIISIAQNTALFSILGTTYGGNGTTTFALPDLRGRVPVGTGNGPGLSNWVMGQQEGTEVVTLTINNLPAHSHPMMVSNNAATAATGANNGYIALAKGLYGTDPVDVNIYNNDPAPADVLGMKSIAPTGGNMPHPNIQPSLGLNYIICQFGIFPTRN
ncbi:MAG TPA: tail fiber protein [Niastella sp.]